MLDMGNAWRTLYKGAKFFVEEDGDQKLVPLLEKVKEINTIMSSLENSNKHMNFLGLKRG